MGEQQGLATCARYVVDGGDSGNGQTSTPCGDGSVSYTKLQHGQLSLTLMISAGLLSQVSCLY